MSTAPVCVASLVLLSLVHQPAMAETNVYGKPMTGCGPSHSTGCTYEAFDAGAHEVCVTELPQGFSSDTGQGPWSDEFTGQPWCICIWAYSNYILQHKNLPLKCDSIPSKVLEEQYSLDKFKECGSMSSTDGCGPEDIRRSIESLCEQCDQQANDDQAAKVALKSKCDAILASAPAAPLARLYGDEASTAAATLPRGNVGVLSLFAYGVLGLAIAGFLVSLRLRSTCVDSGSVIDQLGDGHASEETFVRDVETLE